jgi:3-phenylpropionate/trans-cinnamate dioxygenase ferredoxin reductase component
VVDVGDDRDVAYVLAGLEQTMEAIRRAEFLRCGASQQTPSSRLEFAMKVAQSFSRAHCSDRGMANGGLAEGVRVDEGVVIVGGGLAAQRCAETLRRGGFAGRVRIVCGEDHRPYDRPPLSKGLLGNDGASSSSEFRPESWYLEHEVELLQGARAESFDPAAHTVSLEDASSVSFEQLVIATGARPRRLEAFERYANVSTLRTLEDSRGLQALLAERRKLVVIGAGFIGQEVAAAARSAGADVALIEIEQFPLVGLLGPRVGSWFAEMHRREGVEMAFGQPVTAINGDAVIESLTLGDGRQISCDHVLIGVGVVPELAWVESSGLPTTGVPTDLAGRTKFADVYAAGDAAAFHDAFLDRGVLSGHWEAASRQGAQVANTILGKEPAAPALSSFWSDQYGLRIQYLGHAQLADALTIDGELESRDFVALYTRGEDLIAALVVGRPRAVAELRDRMSHMTEPAVA